MTGFIVELCSGPERSVLNAEEPQLAIPDLTPGTTYQVRIAATSDGGQGKVLLQGLVDWLLVPATNPLPSHPPFQWSKTCKVTTATERPSEPLAVTIVGLPRQHSVTLCWGE